MNVSELARKLKISSKELLEILPAVGFHIGARAIKIDDRQAATIVKQWHSLLNKYRELTRKEKEDKEQIAAAVAAPPKQVTIPAFITVKDFADTLKMPVSKVMAEMMKNGVLSSMNEQIDFDTASIIGTELGFIVSLNDNVAEETEKTTSDKLAGLLTEDDKTKLQPRPPVVVVMGHVDHGKTKLLDTIRTTNVMGGESGGITQHIGAYQVVKKNQLITFIDTPGHEAFTTMRSRGARVADIAILVIAADSSIQPQTKESIKIIQSAGLPMIVAINKIDKPDANIDRVKQDLAGMDLAPEDWGGNTIIVPVSAKAGTGIDELLDMILLVAETEKEHIIANPAKPAVGTLIEAHISRGEGPVATVLIQNGTLHRGDMVNVTGTFYGKVRAMKNYKGEDVDAAGPSMPVKILGLKAAPSVGDVLEVVSGADKSQKINKYQLNQQAVAYTRLTETKEEGKKEKPSVNLLIKADVLGSLEAIIASINQLENPDVAINITGKGLGNITEGDVSRAEASKALIVGFHVKPTSAADNFAKERRVEIKLYDVIYHLLDEIKARIEVLIVPEVIRTELGRLKVLAVFRKDKDAMVIGGSVTKGKIILKAKADILRDSVKIASGYISQLQSNKVNVNEAEQGKECGLKFDGRPIVEVGDILEAYTEEIKTKKL